MKRLPPEVSHAVEELLAKGTPQVDIAKMLGLSIYTVGTRAAARRAALGVEVQDRVKPPRQLVSDERMAQMYRRAGRSYAGPFVDRKTA